jgi:phospholipid/cholesterol/gamma-HCH transport system permease protein
MTPDWGLVDHTVWTDNLIMAVESREATHVQRRPTPARTLSEDLLGSRAYEAIQSAAGMGSLGVRAIRLGLTPPFSWFRDAVDLCAVWLRRSIIPQSIAHAVYLTGFGIVLFGHVLGSIGVVDREPFAMFLIWGRELGTSITEMIFAGLVGAAITADLGARRVREELDALSVLGIDNVRSLVVPRVMATGLVAPILAAFSLLWVLIVNLLVAPEQLGFSWGVTFASVQRAIFAPDLLFTLFLKNFLMGVFVGIVACHKGLTCKLGSEGVGRAVNQTIVISFVGIWMLNAFFNLAYLTAFPGASIVHG